MTVEIALQDLCVAYAQELGKLDGFRAALGMQPKGAPILQRLCSALRKVGDKEGADHVEDLVKTLTAQGKVRKDGQGLVLDLSPGQLSRCVVNARRDEPKRTLKDKPVVVNTPHAGKSVHRTLGMRAKATVKVANVKIKASKR